MNMKPAIYLIPFLIVCVGFLIRWEFSGNRRNIYFIKPISTMLVILAALFSLLEPCWNTTYTFGVILGLVFSMGGDIALMFQGGPLEGKDSVRHFNRERENAIN